MSRYDQGMSMRCWVLALSIGFFFVSVPVHGLDTIYIVRHAEKETPWPREHSDFQPLSDEGRARADALVPLLRDAGIATIYTSPTGRTIQTGMPLARALAVPVKADRATIDADAMPDFMTKTRAAHEADRAVLIVGHSNTIAMLLAALGADATCHDALGVDAEGMIEGNDGLWRVNLGEPGCAGMRRDAQTAVD